MTSEKLAVAQAPLHWFGAVSQVPYRQAWSLLGLLLTPVAVAVGALSAWRFGADAGWTTTFFVASGLLSHWQVWCVFAIALEACAYSLRRAAPRLGSEIPVNAGVRARS